MAEPAPTWPRFELDHLVVAARTLDEGAAWCEATLGAVPALGGRHTHMGTHNALLSVGSARFPRSYLEILAIDAGAAPPALPALGSISTHLSFTRRSRPARAASPGWRGAPASTAAPLSCAMRATTSARRRRPNTHDAARPPLRWRITLRDDGGRPARWRRAAPHRVGATCIRAMPSRTAASLSESVALAGVAEVLVDALGAAGASSVRERRASDRGTPCDAARHGRDSLAAEGRLAPHRGCA